MNEQLPLIRLMHVADGDQERAQILLQLPDATLLKYAEIFAAACTRARFDAGAEFITLRVAAMMRRRDVDGLLDPETAALLDVQRRALVRFVTGPPLDYPVQDPPPE